MVSVVSVVSFWRSWGSLRLAELFENRFERVDHLVARDAALGEAQFQVERFRRRPVGEDIGFRPPRFRLRRRRPKLLARSATLTGNFFDQRGHFVRGVLPNYLQKQ